MGSAGAGTPAPPPAGLAREDGQASSSPFQPFMGMTGVLCCDFPCIPSPPSERRSLPIPPPLRDKKEKMPRLLTFTPSAHTCSLEVILPVWERKFNVRFNLTYLLGLSGCEEAFSWLMFGREALGWNAAGFWHSLDSRETLTGPSNRTFCA